MVESLKLNYPTMDEDILNCITSNDVEIVENIINCNINNLSIARNNTDKREKEKKMIKISNTLEYTRVLQKMLKKVPMSGESIDYYERKKMRFACTTDMIKISLNSIKKIK